MLPFDQVHPQLIQRFNVKVWEIPQGIPITRGALEELTVAKVNALFKLSVDELDQPRKGSLV